MKVETEYLKKIKTIADNYLGEKSKGVSVTYMIGLLKKYDAKPTMIDGSIFYDITKLPLAIKNKLKFNQQ